MLALLELEGLGGATDGSSSKWNLKARSRAYWGDLAQLRTDKASLVAEVAELKQTVEKVEKERNDALAQAYKAGVDRENALAELSQLKADIAREKARKKAAEQAAWDKEAAENRTKRAVQQEVERAREEVEKRRQEALIAAHVERSRTLTAAQKLAALRDRRERDYLGARQAGVASVRDPADDEEEAYLTAQVEAEEREKIRVEAQVEINRREQQAAAERRKARDEAEAERRKNETEAERMAREQMERREQTDYTNRY
jgi:hypothetical protein